MRNTASLVSQNSKPAGSCYLFMRNKCLEHLWVIWSPHHTQKAQFIKTASNTIFKPEIPPRNSSHHPFLHLGGKNFLASWAPTSLTTSGVFFPGHPKGSIFKNSKQHHFSTWNSSLNLLPASIFALKLKKNGLLGSCVPESSIRNFLPRAAKRLDFKNSNQHHFQVWIPSQISSQHPFLHSG